MLMTLLLRTLLPFGLPVVLILSVFFLARRRFEFLKKIPLWLWITIIVVIVAVWILVIVWNLIAQRRRAKAIEQGIMKQAQYSADNATPARRAELEEVKKSLSEAMATLMKGPDGKKALYTLPWYMIIGPPAIGKTTVIVNSGLNFPGLTTAKRMRGSGGTRNCDWWFSTDAILLDTAGRYAQSADRTETETEWFGFLDLLKKHRSKGPINGLILGYSMETLIQADETQIVNDARELRQRMDEILDRLGWTYPVYILYTKCDLINGFADYFSSLSPVERQQVWGATYEVSTANDQDAAPRFKAEFDALCRRLRDLRVRRMASLDKGDAWGRTFMFPEEFASLRGKLHLFVETLFEPNPFKKDVPVFRGTYFSSGKQEGKPFEMVVKKIQAILGKGVEDKAEVQPEKEDAYFVRDLFVKVLKSDRDLVRRTHTAGAKFAKVQIMGSAAFLALSLLSCLWIGFSCTRLGSRMDTTKTMALSVKGDGSAGLDLQTLDHLDKLRKAVRSSWSAFPLNVAYTVRDSAVAVYLDASRKRILVPIEERISEDLNDARRLNADQTRRALRAELLLLSPKDVGSLGSRDDLASVLAQYGFENMAEDSPSMKQLKGLVDEFLRAGVPLYPAEQRRYELESGARRLDETHERREYFDGLVAQAGRCAPDLTLQSLAGDQSILLSRDAVVPAAFTRAGWEKCVSPEIKNVNRTMEADARLIEKVGITAVNKAPTEDELMELYIERFPEAWTLFFEGVALRDYSGCSDAEGDLKSLKRRNGSPLMKMMEAAAAESKLNEGLLGSKHLEAINKAVRPIHAFVDAPKDDESPADAYANQLNNVYDQVAACAEDPKTQIDAAVLRKAENWAADYADRFAGNELARAISTLLKRPVLMTRVVASSEGKGRVQGSWEADVVDFFDSRLARKYPFANSEDMAAPEDVVAFFGADGILESFRKTLEDSGAEVSPGFKRCLDAAGDVRSALRMSGNSIKISFNMKAGEVRPIQGAANGAENNKKIDQVTLTINGTSLVDQRARAEKTFNWSSDDNNFNCSLLLSYTGGNQKIAEKGFSSVWGVCQLFDDARVSGGNTLTWPFEKEGIEVDFTLTMRSGQDCPLFRGSAFRNFKRSIPGSIVN